MITPCERENLSYDLLSEDMDVFEYKKAFAIPSSERLLEDFSGIYDKYGRIISAGSLFRGPELDYVMGKNHYILGKFNPRSAFPSVSDVYWGGFFVGHYGHFIMDTLPRWWNYKKFKNIGYKIALNSPLSREKILSLSWFREFLFLLDIDESDLIVFTFPVIIKNLIVAESPMMDRNCVNEELAKFYQSIGDKATQHSDPELGSIKNVYLTRENLKFGGLHIKNEKEISGTLMKNGFSIVSPENLSLCDQLSLFRNKNITGFVGSAFHNSAFSKGTNGLALSFSKKINRSYALFDAVNAAKISYYHIENYSIEGKEHFGGSFSVLNPEKLVSFIDHWVSGKVKNNFLYEFSDWEKENIPSQAMDIDGPYKIYDHRGLEAYVHPQESTIWFGNSGNGTPFTHSVHAFISRNTIFLIVAHKDAPLLHIDGMNDSLSPVLMLDFLGDKNLCGMSFQKKGVVTSSLVNENNKAVIKGTDFGEWEKFRLEKDNNIISCGRYDKIISLIRKQIHLSGRESILEKISIF